MILSASMGSGHDTVAGELARRLTRAGHSAETIDVLALLPVGIGASLRRFYALSTQYTPWLYEAVYQQFFVPRRNPRLDTSPVVAPAAAALRRLVASHRPDTVVSTFHLAAQMTGRLRQRGLLPVPSIVVICDFAVHRQWVHPGNDLHLCTTGQAAERVGQLGGRGARAVGPVVPEGFRHVTPDSPAATAYARRFAARGDGIAPVLVSGGAWGLGAQLRHTAAVLARGGYLPVVLCGRNRRLRRALAQIPRVVALEWVTDMPDLMAATRALVDNAAGQTAAQALAAGLPVINYRTIAGHGADGARCMASAGLSSHVPDDAGLLPVLRELTGDGPLRDARIAAGRGLFREDAAEVAAEVAADPERLLAAPA